MELTNQGKFMQSKLKHNPHKPEGLVKVTDVSAPLLEILIH